MNGDGRADLVVTRTCEDQNIGVGALLVYLNTGTSFGAAAQYALPSLPTTPGCAQTALVDVDGDYKLDFVVTSLCTDATVGTSQWLVYHNTGSGFDLTGLSYALPPGASLRAFASMEVDAASCPVNQPAFAFFDITGDAIPDMVVSTACDDAAVGVTHWRVYPGTATGVGAPIAFALPGQSVFAAPLGSDVSCVPSGLSTPRYAVVDFNGDLKPDLVVTKSCTDAGAGVSHWSVFPNEGAAFAQQPVFASLPVLSEQPTGAFDALTASVSCTNVSSTLNHTFADVDGDLKPDIVVTQTCGDPFVGATDWLVMRNAGAGFDNPEPYILPAALDATEKTPASDITGALNCATSGSTPGFDSMHLLGPPLDVVVTASCSDSSVGASRWLAFVPTSSQ